MANSRLSTELAPSISSRVFVSAWFLAECYTIARELWIDFTAWKKAVPLIGKRWAAKGKPSADGGEGDTKEGGGDDGGSDGDGAKG